MWYLYGQRNMAPLVSHSLTDIECTKDLNEECVYPEAQRRTRKRKLEEREQKVEHQLARMEMMLRAAIQQMPALAQDQHPARNATAPQESNQADVSSVDSRSPVVSQREQSAVEADPAPRETRTAEGAGAERMQRLHNSEQELPPGQENSIEVRVDSISRQNRVSVPGAGPTSPSSPYRQPTLNSAVAGFEDLLSSPNVETELPVIFTSEPPSDPCKARPSLPHATATASASASRLIVSPGLLDVDWLNETIQQTHHEPVGRESFRDRVDAQVRSLPSAMVTPPSTIAPDGPMHHTTR